MLRNVLMMLKSSWLRDNNVEKEFEELDAELKKCEKEKDLEGLSKIDVKINDYIREVGIDIKTAKRKSL